MSLFLEDWETCEGGLEPHCPGYVVPGNARGLLSQQGMPFSHSGRAVTVKERDVVREDEEKEGV